VQGYNNDLRCDELIDLESTALSTRAECKRILGIETESLSPNGKQEKMNALSEKICREQEYLNGKNLMSHVTGYRGLVNILGNGNLAARSVQARQGKSEVVTSFKEKGRSEEHQIVFDEFTARAAYAQGKDRKGRNRNDPVIIMMRSRDLMTGYQYMDSDGRHFFGRNHNEAAGQYDPFSAEATRENMVILVPSVYREDLVADLSEIAKTQGRTVQELFEARGVVFISQTDYTVSGGVFKGHIFTGGNISGEIGEEDRKVVEHLAEIGRSHLYDGTLSKVEGRVIPTQNTGEGAGGVEGKLYIFKTSGSETVITQLEKNYFAEIAKLISKPKLTLDDWQTIINNISWADANFGKLFQAQVGVAEGYKLRDHTLLGAEILETYFTPIEKPISNGLLRTIWLLHDIGKPEAVEKEGIAGVTKQHEYTLKRLAGIMGGLGFQESDIEIAQAVIDQDFIGNYLRISGTSPNTVAENMISRARNIGIDPRDYYGLVKTHYLIDAGSYTEKAGGQRALDNLFIFDDEAGRMSFSSYNNNDYKIKRLEELLEELLSKEKL
jgi:hypothetical protein